MRTKPIIFGSWAIPHLLDDTKNQTRRVLKPQPRLYSEKALLETGEKVPAPITSHTIVGPWCHFNAPIEDGIGGMFTVKLPYQVGDLLWVREAFTTFKRNTPEEDAAKMAASKTIASLEDLYAWSALPSGGGETGVLYKSDFGEWADNPDSDLGPWSPSIHMPRWAARIWLEVAAVRVERVQEICEEDAKSEGAEWAVAFTRDTLDGEESIRTYRAGFKALWNSINAKRGYGWNVNPFVEVVEFKRVEAPNE